MNENAKRTVLMALRGAFPEFPVVVQESPEDIVTLWVRVFAVPSDQVRAVKNFIHNLEEKLPVDAQAMLLPMVKNLEVTQQHYPEFMPPESAAHVGVTIEQYFLETVRKQREWEPITHSRVLVHEPRLLTPQVDFDMTAIMREPLRPRRTEKTRLAADTELAHAA